MKQWTGAAIVATFLIAYSFAWVLLAGHYADHRRAWRVLGVPAMMRSFDDSRLVLEGVDCSKRGIDPHVEPRCDWRYRLFNYPTVWLWLSYTGLSVEDTDTFGIAIGTVFGLFVLLSFRQSRPLAGVIGGACVVSPAIMLGIERGNTDLVIFSMLVATSILSAAMPRLGDVVLAGGILVAALLKLFPIAAIVCLGRRHGRSVAIALTTILVFVCWAYYWRDDLSLVRATTPEFSWKSFGYKTFFISLFQHVAKPPVQTDVAGYLAPTLLPRGLEWMARLSLLLALAASIVLGVRRRRQWAVDLEFKSEGQCRFLIGAAIYMLTFALGTNFHYRLSFLLLCIPQLVAWAVDPRVPASFGRFAGALAAGIPVICWMSMAPERTFLRAPTEIASWCLFVGFGITMTLQLIPLLAILPKRNVRLGW